jgi:hypothetical protein
MGNHDSLLLATGQVAYPLVGESGGVDRFEHLIDPLTALHRDGNGMPSRFPSRPRPTRSRARTGMSGSSWIFWGT